MNRPKEKYQTIILLESNLRNFYLLCSIPLFFIAQNCTFDSFPFILFKIKHDTLRRLRVHFFFYRPTEKSRRSEKSTSPFAIHYTGSLEVTRLPIIYKYPDREDKYHIKPNLLIRTTTTQPNHHG